MIGLTSASAVVATLGPSDWRPVLADLTGKLDQLWFGDETPAEPPATPALAVSIPAPPEEVGESPSSDTGPDEEAITGEGPALPGPRFSTPIDPPAPAEVEEPAEPTTAPAATESLPPTPTPVQPGPTEESTPLFDPPIRPEEAESLAEEEPAETNRLQQRLQEQNDRLAIDRVVRSVAAQRVFADRVPVVLGLHDLLAETLLHSKAVQAQRVRPAEELQEVDREFGEFDWRGFVDSQFGQDSQPVGDSLQVSSGSPQTQVRNLDHQAAFGVRKETRTGGTFEVSESLGLRDSNSGLLTPPDQGTAAFRITFSQELLRDGGRDVVLSRALIARYGADQVHADALAEISDRLRDVLAAYWSLYEARGVYFIQASLIGWAEETLQTLEAREAIDAEQNSVEQARALLLEARADLANARAGVQIAQDELYRLVNAPGIDPERVEILTGEPPQSTGCPFTLGDQLRDALVNRAEIVQSLSRIREAALDYHVSLNQLLPRLTLSLEGSLNGIEGDFDAFAARGNVTNTDPSYQVGLNFEFFLGNRTARAQNKRAQLALRRLQLEYEDQIEEVRLDVSRSIRTLNASTEVLSQRQSTLSARQKEIRYLQVRRSVAPQAETPASLLIEQQFQAINRLVDSQRAYLTAISGQQVAMAELLRAKGLLLSPTDSLVDQAVEAPSLREARRVWRRGQIGFVDEAKQRVIKPAGALTVPTWR